MANDSVGKISLDLELQSDIDGQLNAIAGKIGSQIEKSLKKASGAMDAEKVVQGMHQEIEALMQNISRVIDAALKRCTESAKMNIDIIGEHLNGLGHVVAAFRKLYLLADDHVAFLDLTGEQAVEIDQQRANRKSDEERDHGEHQ